MGTGEPVVSDTTYNQRICDVNPRGRPLGSSLYLYSLIRNSLLHLFFYFIFWSFFRATPTAHGGSQARGQIGARTAGLHHSHSNTGSELHLWPRPQLMVTPDP